jgi:hypothetical protein
MAQSIDKREYNRVRPLNLHIEYRHKRDDSVYKVSIINISAGGICFIRNSIIHKGDILQIKFPFKSKKIILNAKVIRVEGREVAIKFLESEEKIDKFVEIFNEEYPIISKKDITFKERLSTEKIAYQNDRFNKDLDSILNIDDDI